MSNWDLRLPFHWSMRGGWCTRDRIGGANYATKGFRHALGIQRGTSHLDPWDAQVVTYAFYVERSRNLSGWAHEEWQVEFTVDFTPKFRVRKHIYRYEGLKRLWLQDNEAVWRDSNKFLHQEQQPLAEWEKELEL